MKTLTDLIEQMVNTISEMNEANKRLDAIVRNQYTHIIILYIVLITHFLIHIIF